jgi:uncharacterized protein with HEPN domain
MRNRDLNVIEHMNKYVEQIYKAKDYFGDIRDEFERNFIFQNTIAMSLLQIGELTTHLSDEYKEKHSEINWVGLKRFRNLCAHDYASIDLELVWNEAGIFLKRFAEFYKQQLQSEIGQFDDNYFEEDDDLEFEI